MISIARDESLQVLLFVCGPLIVLLGVSLAWWLRRSKRSRRYTGSDFTVRIEPILREEVRVIYSTEKGDWNFGGQCIGKRWSGIDVVIPRTIPISEAGAIASRLELALAAMGHGYIIEHELEIGAVSDAEKTAAVTELRRMGYKIEVLPNGAISETKLPESPQPSVREPSETGPKNDETHRRDSWPTKQIPDTCSV